MGFRSYLSAVNQRCHGSLPPTKEHDQFVSVVRRCNFTSFYSLKILTVFKKCHYPCGHLSRNVKIVYIKSERFYLKSFEKYTKMKRDQIPLFYFMYGQNLDNTQLSNEHALLEILEKFNLEHIRCYYFQENFFKKETSPLPLCTFPVSVSKIFVLKVVIVSLTR
jgi:hypothetical protein